MKRIFRVTMVVAISMIYTGIVSAYDKGLFDTNYLGELEAYFEVYDITSDNKPGPITNDSVWLENCVKNGIIKGYFKMTLPRKGINAAFKIIKDEGYSTEAYKSYMVLFSTYSFSRKGVIVLMKFDKDGAAWFDSYEYF